MDSLLFGVNLISIAFLCWWAVKHDDNESDK